MSNYDFRLDLENVNTMSVINSWITDGSRILEFGPANGRLTKHLYKERKCNVTIVEMDEEAGSEAAQYALRSFIGSERGNIDNFYWYDCSQQYDYIIFADVLEHLSDPSKILNKCKELLARRGKILVSIPNLAHNSVLIDLLNDRFNYSATGLLDRTHIHFFTYHSFFRMIQEVGLVIIKQKPIYSQVGWNEIDNHYDDVPFEMERFLRRRISGSIYQYVYCIGKEGESEKTLDFSEIEPFENNFRSEETSCYIWHLGGKEDLADRVSFEYYDDGDKHSFQFEINSIPQKIRVDFMEACGLVKVNYIKVKVKDEDAKDICIVNHNALYSISNIFLFKDVDPWIELDITALGETTVEYVEIQFVVLDSHLSERNMDTYSELFSGFYDSLEQDDSSIQMINSGVLQVRLRNYENNLKDAKKYIDHLEEDLSVQTKKIVRKDKDIAEQKDYITHLENDIATQMSCIVQRDRDIAEQKDYITHLENDIATQMSCIAQRDKDIAEQADYIAHLERDIVELKDHIQK